MDLMVFGGNRMPKKHGDSSRSRAQREVLRKRLCWLFSGHHYDLFGRNIPSKIISLRWRDCRDLTPQPNKLYDPVVLHIFTFLDVRDLCRLIFCVCKHWRALLWRCKALKARTRTQAVVDADPLSTIFPDFASFCAVFGRYSGRLEAQRDETIYWFKSKPASISRRDETIYRFDSKSASYSKYSYPKLT